MKALFKNAGKALAEAMKAKELEQSHAILAAGQALLKQLAAGIPRLNNFKKEEYYDLILVGTVLCASAPELIQSSGLSAEELRQKDHLQKVIPLIGRRALLEKSLVFNRKSFAEASSLAKILARTSLEEDFEKFPSYAAFRQYKLFSQAYKKQEAGKPLRRFLAGVVTLMAALVPPLTLILMAASYLHSKSQWKKENSKQPSPQSSLATVRVLAAGLIPFYSGLVTWQLGKQLEIRNYDLVRQKTHSNVHQVLMQQKTKRQAIRERRPDVAWDTLKNTQKPKKAVSADAKLVFMDRAKAERRALMDSFPLPAYDFCITTDERKLPPGKNSAYVLVQTAPGEAPTALYFVDRSEKIAKSSKLSFLPKKSISTLTAALFPPDDFSYVDLEPHLNIRDQDNKFLPFPKSPPRVVVNNHYYVNLPDLSETQLQAVSAITGHIRPESKKELSQYLMDSQASSVHMGETLEQHYSPRPR